MDLPCQEHCSPWGLLHQAGANLLTLTVVEGEGEEEGIQGDRDDEEEESEV